MEHAVDAARGVKQGTPWVWTRKNLAGAGRLPLVLIPSRQKSWRKMEVRDAQAEPELKIVDWLYVGAADF